MSSISELNIEQVERVSALNMPELRRNLVRILFIHHSLADVERCLHELRRVRFTVTSEIVLTPQQCGEELRSEIYDVVVAEYPSSNWQEMQPLDLLRQMKKDVPLIFVVHGLQRETAADLILKGAADCIEMESVGHLPVAIHRALDEKVLRDQRDRAEKDLRRWEARYRALVGNLNYGICRCGLDGGFLEVNETMVSMLGYGSREELLAMNLGSDVIKDLAKCEQLFGQSGKGGLVDTIEMDWRRKDQTVLKVQLSGQQVISNQGELSAYELIAEDVTKQRELEAHLRQQAASDPLTGLANYRRLVDVLHMEIKRCERTGRQFAVLLFDLDGLKLINDQYGHMTGSQALCRVADVLSFCCRDIDTAARFGGDEFALVLPETNAEAAQLVAKRIRESLADDGKGPKLSISVGVAIYPQNGDSIETLLREADSGLYAMKRRRVLPTACRQAVAGL
jgi:diguanylate cyclase (GGDEF)-like protein/PAS domain S-box-containing protein